MSSGILGHHKVVPLAPVLVQTDLTRGSAYNTCFRSWSDNKKLTAAINETYPFGRFGLERSDFFWSEFFLIFLVENFNLQKFPTKRSLICEEPYVRSEIENFILEVLSSFLPFYLRWFFILISQFTMFCRYFKSYFKKSTVEKLCIEWLIHLSRICQRYLQVFYFSLFPTVTFFCPLLQ